MHCPKCGIEIVWLESPQHKVFPAEPCEFDKEEVLKHGYFDAYGNHILPTDKDHEFQFAKCYKNHECEKGRK